MKPHTRTPRSPSASTVQNANQALNHLSTMILSSDAADQGHRDGHRHPEPVRQGPGFPRLRAEAVAVAVRAVAVHLTACLSWSLASTVAVTTGRPSIAKGGTGSWHGAGTSSAV